MRQAVLDAWLDFTGPLEGAAIPYMYADIRGLITVAYGNLIDSSPSPRPWTPALPLPWFDAGGERASSDDVIREWEALKADAHAPLRGHLYARGLTTVRLDKDGIEALVFGKLHANDSFLEKRFPELQDWPASAIMAVHSLSWACGPAFHFPKLEASLRERDFEACAVHIVMNEWTTGPSGEHIRNNGLVPRNKANRILMWNAAKVQEFHLDPDMLDWTAEISPDTNAASSPTICPSPK